MFSVARPQINKSLTFNHISTLCHWHHTLGWVGLTDPIFGPLLYKSFSSPPRQTKEITYSIIRKYSSTSYVGIRQVQNGVMYLRYRSDFTITKAECCKAFTHKIPSLFYCRECSQDSANLSQG